jgi:REP element-mobilizing transposase RayT
MARVKRVCPAGDVFHVLNRAVARLTIFEKPEDYAAFMRVLDETWQIVPLPIFAIVAMPNHWHFVVRPTSDDQVSEFFRRLTVMHTMRYLSRTLQDGWDRSSLSGAFQVVSDSKRRPPADGHALCRAKPGPCQLQ